MRQSYLHLRDCVKKNSLAARLVRKAIRLVPDVPLTLNIPDLGPFRFGLRRHRWFLGPEPLGGSHKATLAVFRCLIRPNDVFYDVGANIGYYLRWVVGHLPVRHTVAFEPMQANLRLLRANISLGKCEDRATVLPFALGDVNREERLQVDDMSDGSAVLDSISGGAASTGRRALGLPPKVETVSVRQLDALLAMNCFPPPNMMKIDTEGAEAMVIRGAAATLRSHRPRLLIATHGAQCVRDTLRELLTIGYRCHGIVLDRQSSTAWTLLKDDDANRLADNNIVCTADGSFDAAGIT